MIMTNINLNNAVATNKKIADLYRRMKDGNIILQPSFQRRFVWNEKHRKELIETILQGFPFPEIYIADTGVGIDNVTTEEVVVDGQQRLTSIRQYIDGEIKIGPKDKIRPYDDLDNDTKRNFMNYKITVRELTGVDEGTIKEIFRRINLTKYSLNSYEIHNAIYSGEFMAAAKELVEQKDIQSLPPFEQEDNGRMQELGLMLLIMSTIEQGGYFNGDSEIETYLSKFDNEYPHKTTMQSKIKKVAKFIKSLKLEPDSSWMKRSNLFTLFIVLSDSEIPSDLYARLKEFDAKLQANKNLADKESNDFSLYYFYTVAGTNSRKARVTRDEIFRKYIING